MTSKQTERANTVIGHIDAALAINYTFFSSREELGVWKHLGVAVHMDKLA